MISELAGDLVGVRWNSDSMDNVRCNKTAAGYVLGDGARRIVEQNGNG
jgi:hypothetical protein